MAMRFDSVVVGCLFLVAVGILGSFGVHAQGPCDKSCEDKCATDCGKKCDKYRLGMFAPDLCLGICRTECRSTGGNIKKLDDPKFEKCDKYTCFDPCFFAMNTAVNQGPDYVGPPWRTCMLRCITRPDGVKPEEVDCTSHDTHPGETIVSPMIPWKAPSPLAENECVEFCGEKCTFFEIKSKNPYYCSPICRYGCAGAGGTGVVTDDLARAMRLVSGYCNVDCYDSCYADCDANFKPHNNLIHSVCMYYCQTGFCPGLLTDGDYAVLGSRFNWTAPKVTPTACPPPTTEAPAPATEPPAATDATLKSCPCDKACGDKCSADCAKTCNSEGFWLDVGGKQVCEGICQTECALTGGNVARIDDPKFKRCATTSCFEPCKALASKKDMASGHPWNACILSCITRAEGIKPDSVDCPKCPFCQFESPCGETPKTTTDEPMSTTARAGKPRRS